MAALRRQRQEAQTKIVLSSTGSLRLSLSETLSQDKERNKETKEKQQTGLLIGVAQSVSLLTLPAPAPGPRSQSPHGKWVETALQLAQCSFPASDAELPGPGYLC